MKKSILFMISALSLHSNAQSEGPYRESKASGTLAKPAQVLHTSETLKKLKVPEGYKLQVYAKDLKDPRMMVVSKEDEVYVSRPKSKDILILKDKNNDGESDERKTFVSDFDKVHGLAILDANIYFVALKKIYVALMDSKDKPTVVIDGLPDVGQHENRSIAIGPDKMLYVSIASNCNSCVDPNKKMATMQRLKLDGTSMATFATGLRDTIGFDWNPDTGEFYGMDHGTDWRGDAIPPEELNLLSEGKDYGWPFCWGDKKPDLNLIDNPESGSKDEFCKKTEAPKLVYDAHAAPIAFRFYRGDMFPELKGSALVAMHGSWNRSKPVGYKVARVTFKNGKSDKFEDFLTGFLTADGRSQSGRPAGIAFLKDGSILISDDSAGVIYRISKAGK